MISAMHRNLFQTVGRVVCGRRLSSKAAAKKTCLYDFHHEHGAKFVEFAGFSMPVQYRDMSIPKSTLHTRNHVSIFDVSHMLQTEVHGKDGIAFLESLIPADLEGMEENHACLSVFTNEKGGIQDDLVVAKTSEGFLYLVSNAYCTEKDLNHLQSNANEWRKKGKDVEIKEISDCGLIAVQGPEAKYLLEPEIDIDLSQLYFMQTATAKVFGVPNCRITRCGYTGEDGFEIRFPARDAAELMNRIMSYHRVTARMAGLGARDVLRLEAGLCLYGNDITDDTTPIEAGLNFVVAKRRRETLGFPGAEQIVKQIKEKKMPKKRVGLVSTEGRPPRSLLDVQSLCKLRTLGKLPISDPKDKAAVGFVTSGCPSPTLNKNIAMGYVDFQDAKVGKELLVDFGSKAVTVTVEKLPFHPTNYYVKPKSK
ncbi:Aminomethyltransferase [Aphelenchoides besseyi]|nr:Aminomethyltransferase [Aphelenchoides besseyi]